jgi:predicted metalloprotease with PDZ domain
MRRLLIPFLFAGLLVAAPPPITLDVDASDAPRRLFHAHMRMPVAAGPLTLVYPKWIRGEHGPNGPIDDLMGLVFTAEGKRIPWKRDPVEMYAFHLEIPPGTKSLEIALDFISSPAQEGFSSASSTTADLAVLNWHLVLLYPHGVASDDVTYAASLRLPQHWKFATALPVRSESEERVSFEPVSLSRLVDSPLIAGAHFRSIPLAPGVKPLHRINLVSDSESALEMPPDLVSHYTHLVLEAGALFGARHYSHYDFLLTLSDQVGHFGLEHHESSDDRVPERAVTDDALRRATATLLPHEFTHSWNGKYRRPADLTTPDFEQPQETDLLWVYEGLTEYLGFVLAGRSGLFTTGEARDYLAGVSAEMDHRPGREWRPLQDTAVAAPVLYNAREDWSSWRRAADFYEEGLLIWLEADVTIRNQSGGKRSLDDFCRSFYGGKGGAPAVATYTFDDIVQALNSIAPHDWREFFETRLNRTQFHAPLGGVEGSGWRVVYREEPSGLARDTELAEKFSDFRYSIGIAIGEDGVLNHVITGMPASQAGIAPGMRLVAVNGRQWSGQILHDALKAAKTSTAPIELLVRNGDFYKTYRIDYREGAKYPRLEQIEGKPDLLAEILEPRAH